MTEQLRAAAEQAFEFIGFCWREVSMNDYALAKLEEVEKTLSAALAAPAVPAHDEHPYTYASTQATNCAGCLEYKHTPLRIDAMGGYVCLTCIDKKLGGLLGEFGYASEAQPAPAVPAEPVAWQYRWTNPGGYDDQPASMFEWKPVEPGRLQSMEDKVRELLAFQAHGNPCYEVRSLCVAIQAQPKAEPLNYFRVQELSDTYRIDYNKLCAALRAYVEGGA